MLCYDLLIATLHNRIVHLYTGLASSGIVDNICYTVSMNYKARESCLYSLQYMRTNPFIINEVSLYPIFRVNELSHNSYEKKELYSKLPFSQFFIEFEKPYSTVIEPDGNKRNVEIVGVLIQDRTQAHYYLSGDGLTKSSGIPTNTKYSCAAVVTMVCKNKENGNLEIGAHESYLDSHGEVHVAVHSQKPIDHIKRCNCLEGNLWNDLNKQNNDEEKVFPMISLSSEVLNELDGGKEFQKHPPCPELSELVRFEYNIRNILACINDKGFRRIVKSKEKQTRSMMNQGKSPIQYVIQLENGVYISNGDKKTGVGTKHRYQYSVRGHFRDTKFGIIWVKNHKRGINHAITIPKEYIL